MSSADLVTCRVCKATGIVKVGCLEFYAGYPWSIFDCSGCGCRFTRHENQVYDLLHSETGSRYASYRQHAEQCQAHFERRDLDGLRHVLAKTSKFRFIIDELSGLDRDAKLLEIGCARGSLTSFFILGGWRVTGVDVSEAAVASASRAFGDRFLLAGAPEIAAGAPYDAIYHVGTIGCVNDPIGMTRELLSMLRPGGRLLFNAPNRAACWAPDQLWFESAPPPDLVTMFPSGFWESMFGQVADIVLEVEERDAYESSRLVVRRALGRSWRAPVPVTVKEDGRPPAAPRRAGDLAWEFVERALAKAARLTGSSRLAARLPAEYGVFVRMAPQ